jgi:hypothetical protein
LFDIVKTAGASWLQNALGASLMPARSLGTTIVANRRGSILARSLHERCGKEKARPISRRGLILSPVPCI